MLNALVAAPTTSTSDAALLAFIATLFAVAAIYLSPTITATIRKLPNLGSVFAINLLLGWSLAGWAVAWALALRSRPHPPTAVPVAAPPGWYHDPTHLRYWTGNHWTPTVHQPPSTPE
jgi:hypothetical protein